MAFLDLTGDQKRAVKELASLTRATAGEIAKLANHCRAITAGYVGNVESILALLQAGDVIPNESGLGNAQDLTKAELVTLIGYCITLSETGDGASGSYNTNYHRGLYAKAAGPANLIG